MHRVRGVLDLKVSVWSHGSRVGHLSLRVCCLGLTAVGFKVYEVQDKGLFWKQGLEFGISAFGFRAYAEA